MKKSKKNFVNECLNLKKRILAISQQVKAIHAAGAFSCLETVFLFILNLLSFQKRGYLSILLLCLKDTDVCRSMLF